MLSCSPGYYLLGQRLIQCRTNGTWSVGNERPICKGKQFTCLQNILLFLIHIFYKSIFCIYIYIYMPELAHGPCTSVRRSVNIQKDS